MSECERIRIEALWRKYLDMADHADDDGDHVGFSRYYRNVASGLALALEVLKGSDVPVSPYDASGGYCGEGGEQ